MACRDCRGYGRRVDAHASAVNELAAHLTRCGCVRVPNQHRIRTEDHTQYHKGWEIRFSCRTVAEAEDIRRLISRAGYNVPAAYRKRKRIIQPLYGPEAIEEIAAAAGISVDLHGRGGSAVALPAQQSAPPPVGGGEALLALLVTARR